MEALLPDVVPVPLAPLVPEDEPVLPDAVAPELPVPEAPAEPVAPVELPLMPLELPVVPDTFEVLRTWLVATSQHCVPDEAPVVPDPDVPEPDEVCAVARPVPAANMSEENKTTAERFMDIP